MKRILKLLTPVLIVGMVLYVLIGFRHVETLNAAERQAIEQYRVKLVKQGQHRQAGIFDPQDFTILKKSFERVHENANYLIWNGSGYPIDHPEEEFATIKRILGKKEYQQNSTYRAFFKALNEDVQAAERDYRPKNKRKLRAAHDILNDLVDFVFTEKIESDRRWGDPKTIRVMKEQGLKVIKK